ncbi:hypothetical protein JCM3774_003379 [Rhodotorula dairenensis]
MKLSITTCLLVLSALSTAQAACHRRSRRAYGEVLIPGNNNALIARAISSVPEPRSVKPVVRRHKGGRRLDIERRALQARGEAWAQRVHHDGSVSDYSSTASSGKSSPGKNESAGASSSESTSSSMTAAAVSSTTSSAPSSSSSSASSSGTYSGQATFFYQDGNAGACGTTHSDSERIIALQTEMFGSGGFCGKTVTITNTDNGKSVTATVADECPGCSSSASLDLSTGAFDAIASEDAGQVPISWSFTD